MIAAAASTITLDANTIILGIIGLVPAILTAFIALRQKEQKDGMAEIHKAVNSGWTTMSNKVDALIEQNKELTNKIATLEENKRGAELAKAVAEAAPTPTAQAPPPVTIATTVSPAGAATPLKKAINDLTVAAKDTADAADKTVELVVKVPHK